jgi:hypothetical protein
MKVLILWGPNRFEAEVVYDQEIGFDQGLEATFKGVKKGDVGSELTYFELGIDDENKLNSQKAYKNEGKGLISNLILIFERGGLVRPNLTI